jgi:ribosomal protein S18 acetylase RimI-like enzyme
VFTIRAATSEDSDPIWEILEAVVRDGETFALPHDMSRDEGLAYWFAPANETFVAQENGEILGSYFIRANQAGGGDHVANCGYMTRTTTRGSGVARAMLEHSLARARERGFRAMQFNFVVSTNQRAVNTWLAYGFEIIGRVPDGYRHASLGYVDALIMYRRL